MPNIQGSINPNNQASWQGYFINPYGAFRVSGTQRGTFDAGYAGSGHYCGFDFDASRSNSIYGSSSTVTPISTTCLFCIKF